MRPFEEVISGLDSGPCPSVIDDPLVGDGADLWCELLAGHPGPHSGSVEGRYCGRPITSASWIGDDDRRPDRIHLFVLGPDGIAR